MLDVYASAVVIYDYTSAEKECLLMPFEVGIKYSTCDLTWSRDVGKISVYDKNVIESLKRDGLEIRESFREFTFYV